MFMGTVVKIQLEGKTESEVILGWGRKCGAVLGRIRI
jgi:hypothetical protein